MLLLFQTTSLISVHDLQLIAPELILTAIACLALVMEVILPYKLSKWTAYFSLAGIALALISLAAQFKSIGGTFSLNALQGVTATDGFYGMVHIDGFALAFRAIFLIAAGLTIAISMRYLDIEHEQHGEYYALILFATVGMMFLGSGYDLISLYIALELMAVTFYVLVAFTKRQRRSNEAGPTSVTAFLSTGCEAASFALYARIFFVALGPMQIDWAPLLGIVAALTIVVGNWAAVTQENSKRLLAYSSISNAGYLLLGLIANNAYGNIGLVIYLLVYTLMNIGAFGVIISLRRRGIIGDNVDDMTGLAQNAPGMAAMMGVFMLSLGGLPMTGGFIGKYFLFGGLLQRGKADGKNWYYWLAILAIINTVVS